MQNGMKYISHLYTNIKYLFLILQCMTYITIENKYSFREFLILKSIILCHFNLIPIVCNVACFPLICYTCSVFLTLILEEKAAQRLSPFFHWWIQPKIVSKDLEKRFTEAIFNCNILWPSVYIIFCCFFTWCFYWGNTLWMSLS